ncbi:MAG TPA: SurA N-terminal domain-containing protein [Candidatus Acidoferrales bacterium]|nr:SurA N-terminal domain-containing protein [Candidatus Acidoferrales bacterium]
MLKFIRRNANAAWVKFIFVAIVVVFIFWGMGGIVGGEKATIVAKVNGEPIDPVDFDRAYDGLKRVYQDIYKDNFRPELLKTFDIKGRAVDQLIHVTLLDQEARHIGLEVSETELRDAIKGIPAFQADGAFSKDLYVRALRANGLTPGEFEEAERQELLVKKMEDLIKAGVHVSDADVHDRYVFDHEQVNLHYVKLDPATFQSQLQLTDVDLQAYYDANKEQFKEPDRVRIEYIMYALDKFLDKTQVSDADVQRYYDNHAPDYEKPEQVHARHILFKVAPDAADDMKQAVRQKAEEVLAKAKSGEDFAELAKQSSDDSTSAAGGDLGFFSRGRKVKPLEEAAFALHPGEISDLVESPLGFHIVKVEAFQPARTQPVDEVREEITATLKVEKSRDVARAQAEADRTKVVDGATLASVAAADGLEVLSPAPIAENDTIGGVPYQDVNKAAFAASPGTVAPVVTTPNGPFLVRVIEKVPAHVPELAEIRDRVDSKARQAKAQALAKAKADALLAAASKSDLDSAAKADNLSVEETGSFGRQSPTAGNLGNAPDLKKDAFRLTTEKPVAPAVYNVSGNSVVAALKERIPADEEKFKADKETLTHQAEERRQGQAMEEFVNYLKARAAIEVNEDFLASVTDSGRPSGGRSRRSY